MKNQDVEDKGSSILVEEEKQKRRKRGNNCKKEILHPVQYSTKVGQDLRIMEVLRCIQNSSIFF